MTIRLQLYSLLTSFFIIFISCNEKSSKVPNSANDTTEIIQILIDSTIDLPRLSNLNQLYKNNPFDSSVIVKIDSTIYRNFPTTYKFKFLTNDEICVLAKQFKDSSGFPNYLEFKVWKIEDSIYSAAVTNIEIQNQNSCILVVNQGCFKLMTFKKEDNKWTSKIEATLHD